jgi:oxygen-independent coproporphyrinogen-3 oxidase
MTTTYQLSSSERISYRHYAGLALPRHTSYPIPSAWTPDYGPVDLQEDLRRSSQQGRPLSLYVHIPFCERLCYYCACNKEIVPPEKRRADDPSHGFLQGLETELDRFAEIFEPGEVHQIHLGGGSPTFLSPADLHRLWNALQHRLPIAKDAEIAIEIDPRITTFEHLQTLRGLGFNRVSLGIQDFAPEVQRAVNRVQPLELVQRLVSWCRSLGFASTNFDLIYGLPFQTQESMAETLEKTVALSPDRVAFYRLAVIPEMFRWQRTFRHTDLPSGDLPLENASAMVSQASPILG